MQRKHSIPLRARQAAPPRRRAGGIALLLALGVLAGCVSAPETTEPPKPVPAATQTVYVPVYVEVEKRAPPPPAPEPLKLPDEQEQSLTLLLEMTRTVGVPADELRKEYAAAQTAFNKERTAINRLRYAWLAALLGPAAGDEARLQGLLEPLVAKGGLAASHPLRPLVEVLLAQIAERNRQLREEQKRADALQQKLDALKAIEKQLLDRERRRN